MSPVVKIAGFTAMLVAIFALGLLEDHANHCIIGGEDSKADERTSELMGAVKRLLRHGQPRAFNRLPRTPPQPTRFAEPADSSADGRAS